MLVDGDNALIDNAIFDSAAKKAGLDFDQKILKVLAPAEQPSKYWMFVPAALLLWLVIILQGRRKRSASLATVAA